MLKFKLFFMSILFCRACGSAQGFAPIETDSPFGHGLGGPYDEIFFGHSIVSKRDASTLPDTVSHEVQTLISKVDTVLNDVQEGVKGGFLKHAMWNIAIQAEKVITELEEAGESVSETDINNALDQLPPDYLPLVKRAMADETPKLHIDLDLLLALVKQLKLNPNEIIAVVGAIQKTAEDAEKTIDDLEELFKHLFKTVETTKRQTTTGSHVEHGPWGTSGGVSVSHTTGGNTYGGHVEHGPGGTSGGATYSHTSGGTTYGGHVDYGPGGTSSGISGSHTWNHGGGSSTTAGGYVDHSNTGSTSGGISVTHTFGGRRRQSDRETTVGGHVETGPGGTSGGVSASHTWNHSGGSSTTAGGHVDHSSSGGTSGGVSISHSWRRRFLNGLKKRQTTIGGHVDTGPWGTSGGISGSHTIGGTTYGGHVDTGPWGTSGGISGSHTFGDNTYGGHLDYGPAGTSGGISTSHTIGGTTYGSHLDYANGHTSGGLSASHTWNHGDGSSTSLGGYVDHSHGAGTSGGVTLTHTFG